MDFLLTLSAWAIARKILATRDLDLQTCIWCLHWIVPRITIVKVNRQGGGHLVQIMSTHTHTHTHKDTQSRNFLVDNARTLAREREREMYMLGEGDKVHWTYTRIREKPNNILRIKSFRFLLLNPTGDSLSSPWNWISFFCFSHQAGSLNLDLILYQAAYPSPIKQAAAQGHSSHKHISSIYVT